MKKSIIFDNDEDILSVCRYILKEDGWEVHTFTDCDQLVERVSEILPEAILMDDWIPPKGGVPATQLLKQTAPLRHIPVVYFSTSSGIGALAAKAGADTYLAKPFDLDELFRLIGNAQGILTQVSSIDHYQI